MVRAVAGFDWDAGNSAKRQKHGVSIAEIESLFEGTPRIAPDVKHSMDEDRLLAIGRTARGRGLFVAFMFRMVEGTLRIRPVNARYLHGREIDAYEKESP